MMISLQEFLKRDTLKIISIIFDENNNSNNNEISSWKQSIKLLKEKLSDFNQDFYISFEEKLPFSGKRIDFCFIFEDEYKVKNIYIIEIKRWEEKNLVGVYELDSLYFGSKEDIRMHPAIQVINYMNTIENSYLEIKEKKIKLYSVVLMPNFENKNNEFLNHEVFKEYIKKVDYFVLKKNIDEFFKNIKIKSQNSKIENCDFFHNKTFSNLDNLWLKIKNMEPITLLNDQLSAVEQSLIALKSKNKENKNTDIIIYGGAGSGKTVVGLAFLQKIIKIIMERKSQGKESKNSLIYASSQELCKYFQNVIELDVNNVFKLFGAAITNIEPNTVIILDESQRMTLKQVEDIVEKKQSKEGVYIIWLIDERQSINIDEDNSIENIEKQYLKNNLKIQKFSFENNQFRCSKDPEFNKVIEKLFDNQYISYNNGQIHIYDTFHEAYEKYIKSKKLKGFIASDSWSKGCINIESYNFNTINNFGKWSSNLKENINSPASVYKVQGGQKELILFLWGNEFVYRSGKGWIFIKENFVDKKFINYLSRNNLSSKVKEDYVLRKLKNIYYVLMTRFTEEMYIHCIDEETRNYLKSIFNDKPSIK